MKKIQLSKELQALLYDIDRSLENGQGTDSVLILAKTKIYNLKKLVDYPFSSVDCCDDVIHREAKVRNHKYKQSHILDLEGQEVSNGYY